MIIRNFTGAPIQVPTGKAGETFTLPVDITTLSAARVTQFNDAKAKDAKIKELLAKGGLVELPSKAKAPEVKAPAAPKVEAAKPA